MNSQKLSLDELEAAEELIRRRSARQSLVDYTGYTFPAYIPAAHHRLICAELEAVERGDTKRLIIETPPRHGKSELASIRFPAWYIGRNPDKQLMAASYNAKVAARFGRQARNLVMTQRHQALFPGCELAADSKAVDTWHTQAGGIYACGGIGFGTSFGAHVFLIDDPVKGREEADSDTVRETIRNWYQSVVYTRLLPGGAIAIIYTPWHDEDLGQWLLRQADENPEADQWRVVRLPAMAEEDDPLGREPGKALWPAWYNEAALEQIKRTVGPREWQALYQCDPVADSGDYFERAWFKSYDQQPRKLRPWLVSDFAVSTKESADWTVHQVWGTDNDINCYLLEQWREKADTDRSIDAALDLVAEYRCMGWINEKGVIRAAIGPAINRRMRERNIHARLIEYARPADKATFARTLQARLAGDRILVPKTKSWYPAFEAEFMRFPVGQHDDQVDTAALFCHHLDKIGPATPAQPGRARVDFSAFG